MLQKLANNTGLSIGDMTVSNVLLHLYDAKDSHIQNLLNAKAGALVHRHCMSLNHAAPADMLKGGALQVTSSMAPTSLHNRRFNSVPPERAAQYLEAYTGLHARNMQQSQKHDRHACMLQRADCRKTLGDSLPLPNKAMHHVVLAVRARDLSSLMGDA